VDPGRATTKPKMNSNRMGRLGLQADHKGKNQRSKEQPLHYEDPLHIASQNQKESEAVAYG
jgi:hypothetical protein